MTTPTSGSTRATTTSSVRANGCAGWGFRPRNVLRGGCWTKRTDWMPRRSCRRQATADMTGSDTMGGGMYGSIETGCVRRSRAVPFRSGRRSTRWSAGREIVVDRPRGSHHPDFPEFVYELDYGYLKGTTSADGEGDRCLDRQRSPSAGDRCALYGRSGEARRRTENSRRLYGRRLCRDPAFYRTPLSAVRILRRKSRSGLPALSDCGFFSG